MRQFCGEHSKSNHPDVCLFSADRCRCLVSKNFHPPAFSICGRISTTLLGLIITSVLFGPLSGVHAAQTDARTLEIIQTGNSVIATDSGEDVPSSGSARSREYALGREELGYLILGIVFVAIGLVTLLLTVLQSATRDATTFLFGAMSCVWGIRFLLYTQLVPLLLAGDPQALQSTARAFTYFGASAAFGFAVAYLGPGWRSSLRGLAYISLAFSCVASLVLLLNPDRDLLLPVFNVMILIGAMTIIANTLHPNLRQQIRQQGLIAGFFASVFFVVLENLRALGIIPIPWDVEWIGVLILYLTLGRLIAVHMFTNERRLASISQELATARQIQESLLPRQAPQISGLSMAARYVPMTEVAGDIYDYIQLDGYRQGILIADVSGHGVPAALIASMVKGAFRAQIEHIETPDRVLAGMNRILTGQLDLKFVTASCTFIDMEARILRYSGAGHPPLLIKQKDSDKCNSLQLNGLVLGHFPNATYSSVERPLAAGDRLLLYTDGIIEPVNALGEEFGENSLRELLARHGELSASGFADALLEAIGGWTSSEQDKSVDDDRTLVVIDVQ